jgi:hypothetical protein
MKNEEEPRITTNEEGKMRNEGIITTDHTDEMKNEEGKMKNEEGAGFSESAFTFHY